MTFATESIRVVIVLQPRHHAGHQLLQMLGSQPARLQNLLVVGFLLAVVVHDRLVADQRQGKAAHAGVAGDDDLVDGAHPCRRFRQVGVGRLSPHVAIQTAAGH